MFDLQLSLTFALGCRSGHVLVSQYYSDNHCLKHKDIVLGVNSQRYWMLSVPLRFTKGKEEVKYFYVHLPVSQPRI